MATAEPVTGLDNRYGEPGVQPTSWAVARDVLTAAELSWISTVRPDCRPHVTPLLTVCEGSTVFFCTGPEERKCRNLTENRHVVLTTGRNTLHGGLDRVVEGDAVRVTDESTLRRLAEAWVASTAKTGGLTLGSGAFVQPGGGEAWVFAVEATAVFGFGRDPHSQTRWRFVRD